MTNDINTPKIIAGMIVLVMLAAGLIADVFIISALQKRKIDWKSRLLKLQARPWDHYDGIYILLVLGTLFAAIILSTQILDQCGIILSDTTEKILILAETILMQVITIAAIENLRRKHILKYKECFSTPELSISTALKQSVLFYIAIIPPIFFGAFVVTGILSSLNIPLESQEIFEMFSEGSTPLWVRSFTIMLAIAIAPITEEILFRGIVLPIATKHTSIIMAVIASSMLFAIIHANLQSIAPLFILATGLSMAYIYTRSIIVPIAMHAIFNTVSLMLYLMAT